MKYYNKVIIGIDYGYGNIKTANHIFKAGVLKSETEPVFQANMLVYGGKYYLIGEGHKEFNADKISDEEYYILTLAGIAVELSDYGLTEANILCDIGYGTMNILFLKNRSPQPQKTYTENLGTQQCIKAAKVAIMYKVMIEPACRYSHLTTGLPANAG